MQESGLLMDYAMFQEHYDAFFFLVLSVLWYSSSSSFLFCSRIVLRKGYGLILLWIQCSSSYSSRVPIVNRHVHYASVMFKEYSDYTLLVVSRHIVINIEFTSTQSDFASYLLNPGTLTCQAPFFQ